MKVNLEKGISLQISGEVGKNNTLPIDYLVKLAENLQNLILTIARFDLETTGNVDIENFKIELFGFKKGSAVPQFVLTERVNMVVGDDVYKQRKVVSKKFDQLVSVSNSGDYRQLKTVYPDAFKRNQIVEGLYKFVHDIGTTPVKFVEVSKNDEIKPLYSVKKFNPQVKKELVSGFVETKQEEEITEDLAVATVKVIHRKGKTINKIQEVYNKKSAGLSYTTEVIVAGGVVYNLAYPLRCLLEKEEDYYIIKSEMLDIIGTGLSEDEAEASFSQEFHYIYTRFNELPESKLSDRIKVIKTILNSLVKSKE